MDIYELQSLVRRIIDGENYMHTPADLYAPIEYTMRLGGKRLRPTMLLAACQLFGGRVEDAHNAAIAIEVFHNYTLLHDDLMDKSPLRRGQPTVYRRWSENTAILSGDTMMALAYQYVAASPKSEQMLPVFSQTALDVMAGQQYDMEFENRIDVSAEEYLEMIYLKTAALFCGAMKMGAMLADAPAADIERLMLYGRYLGLAFQLQDDILDTYGNEVTFGKKPGQDIRDNKKTMLLITALNDADAAQRDALLRQMESPESDAKVDAVRAIYDAVGVREKVEKVIDDYMRRAAEAINAVNVSNEAKQPFQELMQQLIGRKN